MLTNAHRRSRWREFRPRTKPQEEWPRSTCGEATLWRRPDHAVAIPRLLSPTCGPYRSRTVWHAIAPPRPDHTSSWSEPPGFESVPASLPPPEATGESTTTGAVAGGITEGPDYRPTEPPSERIGISPRVKRIGWGMIVRVQYAGLNSNGQLWIQVVSTHLTWPTRSSLRRAAPVFQAALKVSGPRGRPSLPAAQQRTQFTTSQCDFRLYWSVVANAQSEGREMEAFDPQRVGKGSKRCREDSWSLV